jgi:O-antigen ligase
MLSDIPLRPGAMRVAQGGTDSPMPYPPDGGRLAGPGKLPRPPVELLLVSGGFTLTIASIAWLLLMAEISGGDATAMCGLLLAIVLAFVVARWLTSYSGWMVPFLVAAAAGLLAISHLDTLLVTPYNNPLGYSNAVGSFYMVAAAAALFVAVRVPQRGLRLIAAAGSIAAALVPVLNSTATASVLVCLLPLALFAKTPRATRIVVIAAAGVMLTTLLTTVYLGASYQPGQRNGTMDRIVDATLSERRPELWHDALVMVTERPLTGVGPNRFPEESPTARKDRDSKWPHNEALHFAAEAGIPGLLLLLGLFGWGFAWLWWGAGDRGTAIAALALGAVGVHSTVDYVLHFPAVGLAMAALVGAGSCLPHRNRSTVPRVSLDGPSVGRSAKELPVWDLSFLGQPQAGRPPRVVPRTKRPDHRK